ncbi:hypothetical protein [Streptomyces anulatus]|uniref:hypothetical protein n=1 Tax=Streptomyces anulatus TaxID=1892 RepID=UPI001C26FC2E|nr:hypothetical protein [Streptomyces anulatus]
MKDTTTSSQLVVPRLTISPDLPAVTQEMLRTAKPLELRDPDPAGSGSVWRFLAAPLRRDTLIVCAGAVAFYNGAGPNSPINDLLWPAVGIGATWLVLMTSVPAAGHLATRNRLRRIQEVREQYVLDADLVPAAGQLLARADHAVAAVRRSKVHRDDHLDRQRNDVVLPAKVWDIAEMLRSYSRVERSTPTTATGDEARPVLDAHQAVLQTALEGIERRVTALETYAEQTAQADLRYTELLQIQQISATGSELLELLARSVSDDLAVTEIDGLTTQAATVADAFKTALAQARDSAHALTAPTAA